MPERKRSEFAVVDPVAKFAIAALATLCAGFTPKLIALFAEGTGPGWTFFTWPFIGGVGALAIVVGSVITVFEWKVPRPPRDTFLAALGVPAVLVGALGATDHARDVKQFDQATSALSSALQQEAGIPILPAAPSVGEIKGSRRSLVEPWRLADLLVMPLHAQSAASPRLAQPSRFGIVKVAPQYLIVLDRDDKEAAAHEKMAVLARRIPRDAQGQSDVRLEVVKSQNAFLVVVAGGARASAAATLDAVKLKEKYGLSPSLLPLEPR